jgi:hypothetical protein
MYKAQAFDPLLVSSQIIFVSAASYTTLGFLCTVLSVLLGLQLGGDVLTFGAVGPFTAIGWLLILVHMANAGIT